METAVCDGFVQNNAQGFAVCTNVNGDLLPWVESVSALPFWVQVGAFVGLSQAIFCAVFLVFVALKWRARVPARG